MKKLGILLFSFLLMTSSYAGFHVEPILGYTLLSDGEIDSASGTEYSFSGPSLAGRVGFSTLGFSVGAYYGFSTGGTYKAEGGGASVEYDADKTDMGVFAAYEFPILVKVYAQYFVNSKFEIDFNSGPSEYKGSGHALGVGFTGLPFVDLNLELRNYTYDELEQSGSSFDLDSNNEFKMSEIFASVSVPFDF